MTIRAVCLLAACAAAPARAFRMAVLRAGPRPAVPACFPSARRALSCAATLLSRDDSAYENGADAYAAGPDDDMDDASKGNIRNLKRTARELIQREEENLYHFFNDDG